MQSYEHNLEFNGNGTEYAKIFFVNLALTLLTFGIYSAWAKVRNKRYFYGNTSLANNSFDYHAKPVQILKGRLIAVVILIIYSLTAQFIPILAPAFWIGLLALLPWLVLKSMQFNMQNTSYRQIRFNFLGQIKELTKYYVWYPMAASLTMWLAYPYVAFHQKKYLADNVNFGQSKFSFNGKSKEFFFTYFSGIVVAIMVAVILYLSIAPTFQATIANLQQALQIPELSADQKKEIQNQISGVIVSAVGLGYIFIIIIGLFLMTFIKTRIINYLYSNLKLNYVRFKVNISYLKLVWIYLSNAVLIMLSFGIFIPWAKVRAVKYKLSKVTIYSIDLDNHLAAADQNSSKATGEEMNDLFDMGIGI